VQFLDSLKTGRGPLEFVDLLTELKQGFAQHRCVVEDEVDGADRECAFVIQPDAHPHRERVAECEHHAGYRSQDLAHDFGTLDPGEDAVIHVVEALHCIVDCAVGADVFETEQALLDEAVHLRVAFALGRVDGDGDVPGQVQDAECEDGEKAEGGADAPVLQVNEDDDAGQEDDASDHLQHELGKEVGQGRCIAIDALDHFTGRMLVVKSHIQVEAVVGEVVAHLVRRAPPHILSEIGADDLDALSTDPDGEEEDARPDEAAQGPVGLCGVDEVAKDLRIEQTEPDPDHHTDGEEGDAALVGTQIPGEEGGVVSEGYPCIRGGGFWCGVDLLPPGLRKLGCDRARTL